MSEPHKTSDAILASAMGILAESIVSEDGVANAAIREAGQRITELAGEKELTDIYRSEAEKLRAKYEAARMALIELVHEVDRRCGGKIEGNSPLAEACEKAREIIEGKDP